MKAPRFSEIDFIARVGLSRAGRIDVHDHEHGVITRRFAPDDPATNSIGRVCEWRAGDELIDCIAQCALCRFDVALVLSDAVSIEEYLRIRIEGNTVLQI